MIAKLGRSSCASEYGKSFPRLGFFSLGIEIRTNHSCGSPTEKDYMTSRSGELAFILCLAAVLDLNVLMLPL